MPCLSPPLACQGQLTAIAVAIELAKRLAQARRYYTYRFLFAPGTIGSITYLAHNRAGRQDQARLVLACADDSGYKRSRRGARRSTRSRT